MTIGIIEDDTLLHQALKTALQNAGYQTVSAYTKQEALTTITGSERTEQQRKTTGMRRNNIIS